MSKPNLLPYHQVKLTLLKCKLSFLENPPQTEDEQYAYDIIQKAYEINEKRLKCLILTRIKSCQRITIGGLIAD